MENWLFEVSWVLHNCNVATETTRGVGRIVYLHHRSLLPFQLNHTSSSRQRRQEERSQHHLWAKLK